MLDIMHPHLQSKIVEGCSYYPSHLLLKALIMWNVAAKFEVTYIDETHTLGKTKWFWPIPTCRFSDINLFMKKA